MPNYSMKSRSTNILRLKKRAAEIKRRVTVLSALQFVAEEIACNHPRDAQVGADPLNVVVR